MTYALPGRAHASIWRLLPLPKDKPSMRETGPPIKKEAPPGCLPFVFFEILERGVY